MPYPAASVVAVCANVYKQNMIFPAPTASTGGNKNQSEQSLNSARLQECCRNAAHIVFATRELLRSDITTAKPTNRKCGSNTTVRCPLQYAHVLLFPRSVQEPVARRAADSDGHLPGPLPVLHCARLPGHHHHQGRHAPVVLPERGTCSAVLIG